MERIVDILNYIILFVVAVALLKLGLLIIVSALTLIMKPDIFDKTYEAVE